MKVTLKHLLPVDGTLLTVKDKGIARVGYIRASSELIIEFTTGAQFLHRDVPESKFVDMMCARNPGGVHRYSIRGHYKTQKIAEPYSKRTVISETVSE